MEISRDEKEVLCVNKDCLNKHNCKRAVETPGPLDTINCIFITKTNGECWMFKRKEKEQ